MLRRPDSIPSGDTLIQDPAMEPFFISKSQSGGYTVYERVIKGDNSTPYIKTICYPSNFNFALKAVCRELLHSKNTNYSSIKEYIKEWETIQDRMTNLTTI